MSKFEWSTTAADNDDADANVNWTEGQAPSTVNNSARAVMAAEASWLQGIGGALTTAGTGAAYTLTLADVPTAYTTSMLFLVKFHAVSSSTAPTLNVNALGAKTIKTWGGAALPVSTHIPVNSYGFVKYDGTDFRVFLPSLAGLTDTNNVWAEPQVFSSNIRSVTITIADDAVGTFTIASTSTVQVHIGTSGAAGGFPRGAFTGRAGTSPYTENLTLDLTNVTLTNTVLTGTSGTDGKVTLSMTGGLLYIENRSGSSTTFYLLVIR